MQESQFLQGVGLDVGVVAVDFRLDLGNALRNVQRRVTLGRPNAFHNVRQCLFEHDCCAVMGQYGATD